MPEDKTNRLSGDGIDGLTVDALTDDGSTHDGLTDDGLKDDSIVTDPVSRCTPEQVERLKYYVRLLLDVNIRINLISRKDTADVFDRHVRHSLVLAARDFPDGCTVVDWGTGGGLPAIPLAIRFPNINVVAVDSIGKKTRAVEEMASALGLKNLSVWNGRAEEWNGKAHYSVSRATARLDKLWGWHKRIRIPLDVSQLPASLIDASGSNVSGSSVSGSSVSGSNVSGSHASGDHDSDSHARGTNPSDGNAFRSKTAGIDSAGTGGSGVRVATSLWNPGLICLKGGDLTEEIAALTSKEKKVRVNQRSIADIAPGYPDKCLVQVSRI